MSERYIPSRRSPTTTRKDSTPAWLTTRKDSTWACLLHVETRHWAWLITRKTSTSAWLITRETRLDIWAWLTIVIVPHYNIVFNSAAPSLTQQSETLPLLDAEVQAPDSALGALVGRGHRRRVHLEEPPPKGARIVE